MFLTDDGHPLAVRVEVEQRQHFVGRLLAHFLDGDRVLGAGEKHEAKIPCRRHQGAFVRRRCLIHQLA